MKKIKNRENVTFTIFLTTLLRLMLSSRLLQPIIDGKKIIIVIFSNRKQKVT